MRLSSARVINRSVTSTAAVDSLASRTMGRNFKARIKSRLTKGGIKKCKAEKTLYLTHERGRQDESNTSAGERLLKSASGMEATQRKEKQEAASAKQAAMLRARAKRAAEEEARAKAEATGARDTKKEAQDAAPKKL